MAHLTIRLLGSYQVTAAERPVTVVRWAKMAALLAYLVLESDRAHARCELVELLWPEQAHGTGLADLRQVLFRLRRHLCDNGSTLPCLLITPNDIQFNRAADCWLDVAEFR